MIRRLFLLLAVLAFVPASLAAIDTYEFDTEEQRARFYQLSGELRCPKCQNQNIADSNSPIANDLRREIFRMLDEGQSNDQIVEFMVMRYGDFVRYKPALTAQTAVLWFAPAVFLLAGFIGLVVMLRRRQRALRSTADQHLNADEQQRLKSLLEKKSPHD
ncbi:cytochrome c-type biogenesis protein CcmH [Halopseudomonas laoshanensis]|uniref:Cytochrome c-type biogenesis protein n=1 Tax=Halopseudomonas laoshanensis TaxID=2268758 RepID=A0A7V7GU30_9GAMM|nr:cytochrome c-type biogenesis protein [Halopseudomonas laoshanensis]KAA0694595.1 cytochrome c-type biogenesis protein CcmH [Halopseudomonas laoshanensis]